MQGQTSTKSEICGAVEVVIFFGSNLTSMIVSRRAELSKMDLTVRHRRVVLISFHEAQ